MISSGQTLTQSGGFASTLGSVAGLHAPPAADPIRRLTRLLPTEFAFLRFTAGIRALLAVLIGTLLLGAARPRGGDELLVLLPYLAWSALLLWKTLNGWPRAASKAWLWADAGVLLVTSQLLVTSLPLFGISTVLPVVALAVLAGAIPALSLSLACAAGTLWLTGAPSSFGGQSPLSVIVPVIVLAVGPAAALLARPCRELRQRLTLVDTFNEQADPRQGLCHNVDMLLGQLAAHYELNAATISLQGPEPRIFQWQAGARTVQLAGAGAASLGGLLAQLPRDLGCLCSVVDTAEPVVVALHPSTGARSALPQSAAWAAFGHFGSQTLTLPIVSYGQPLGTVCLHRSGPEFALADLRLLGDVMQETMPLLERSDLLEQLQRETASRERERIGRDLHDSAVQPYLGLKYGLEALARQAGPANPLSGPLAQLVHMATDELQTLRDVISGLRSGDDPTQAHASLAALERQTQRFQALYGLKVRIVAPHAPQLRGAAAKAVLHMVNEALTNARRHTSATEVTVQLDVDLHDVVLRLRNDCTPGEARPRDFVPRSLTERAAEFGGAVSVTHRLECTEIVITLPLLGVLA